jgi:hypothetical protein
VAAYSHAPITNALFISKFAREEQHIDGWYVPPENRGGLGKVFNPQYAAGELNLTSDSLKTCLSISPSEEDFNVRMLSVGRLIEDHSITIMHIATLEGCSQTLGLVRKNHIEPLIDALLKTSDHPQDNSSNRRPKSYPSLLPHRKAAPQ